MPVPPYSSSTVMPSSPSWPSLGHRSRGNSLERSISAARGAISRAAKRGHRLAQDVDGFAQLEVEALVHGSDPGAE